MNPISRFLMRRAAMRAARRSVIEPEVCLPTNPFPAEYPDPPYQFLGIDRQGNVDYSRRPEPMPPLPVIDPRMLETKEKRNAS